MVENNSFAAANGAARVLALSLVACAMAVSVAASPAQAAEVDAIGSPAPVGFADVIERVKPAIADALALKSTDGALVAQVEPNSPAAKAGIEIGDVMVTTDVAGDSV